MVQFAIPVGYDEGMSDQITSRRRWLTFSLRAALGVLTVFCVWLGWQVNLVHQRNAMRAAVEQSGGIVDIFIRPEFPDESLAIMSYERSGPVEEPEIPQWRRWLGDEAISQLILPAGSSEPELARARALFPEAEVEERTPGKARQMGGGMEKS